MSVDELESCGCSFKPERSPDRPTGQIAFTRQGEKMNGYERVIGIDVCTERLDISDSGKAIPMASEYAIDEIKSKILKKIKDPKKTLVVCEASGGLEYALVDALHDAKIDVCVANPARVRDFAKGHGFFEKSDKLDAQMLQLYGQQVKVTLAKPRTQEERSFIALTRRRCQLLQLLSQEGNRARQCVEGPLHGRVGGHPKESCHSSLLHQTDYRRETKEACTRCLYAQTADDSQRYGSA